LIIRSKVRNKAEELDQIKRQGPGYNALEGKMQDHDDMIMKFMADRLSAEEAAKRKAAAKKGGFKFWNPLSWR
jgi:hypothetical protein